MLSYNRKFGLGAALRQRSIWSGSARSVNGLVTAQLNPYKPRGITSPAGIVLEGVSHNGTVYAGMVGANVYTSPDLVTFTQRTIPGASTHVAVAAAGTRLVGLSAYTSTALSVSSDNGVTWGGGTVVNNGTILRSAGGVAFALSPFSSSGAYACDSTGAIGARTLPEARVWIAVGSTGTAWVMVSSTGTAAYSNNANATTWATSASYATEAAKLPAYPTQVYGVGTRLVAVAATGTALATIYSDDGGVTWQQGASYGVFLEGRSITGLSPYAAVLDGHLYVSVVAGGKGMLISTHNGVIWRPHTDINTDGTLPGLCKRPGVDSILFNGSATAGPALETNAAAQELYYEL